MEILIVEDSPSSRALMTKVLAEKGHQIIACENGRQAWELLQKQPIQVIVTDWNMPEMDGLELCRHIRNASFDWYTFIIVVTSNSEKKHLLQVFEAGADDFITKPFDPAELRARVSTGVRLIGFEHKHKSMQRSLLESHNRLRTVIDSLQEEIVAVSPEFKIEAVNDSFSKCMGLNVDAIVGMSCHQLDHAQQKLLCAQTIKPLVEEAFATGVIQRHLHAVKDENGLAFYKQFVCLPVRNEAGQAVQVLIVGKDITEERRRTNEIEALNERLTVTSIQLEAQNQQQEITLKKLEATQAQMLQSEKMASIGQLAAGVAHEINNPTGFVSSNLKTLGDYKNDLGGLIAKYQDLRNLLQTPDVAARLGAEVETAIQAVQSCEKDIDIDFVMTDIGDLIGDCRDGTERIKKIVLDLKDFAHPGEDKLQSVDVNKGLASTLNVVKNEIKYKAVVQTDFGDIPLLNGYPQQLNQVFMNILVNAAQAIEKEGRIEVKTQAVNGNVIIHISDTGCGIAPQNISKIFDPFFTTKEVGKGTGLGMNIAYNIIKKHHGSIEVQSEVGKGTTFTIRLPVEKEV